MFDQEEPLLTLRAEMAERFRQNWRCLTNYIVFDDRPNFSRPIRIIEVDHVNTPGGVTELMRRRRRFSCGFCRFGNRSNSLGDLMTNIQGE